MTRRKKPNRTLTARTMATMRSRNGCRVIKPKKMKSSRTTMSVNLLRPSASITTASRSLMTSLAMTTSALRNCRNYRSIQWNQVWASKANHLARRKGERDRTPCRHTRGRRLKILLYRIVAAMDNQKGSQIRTKGIEWSQWKLLTRFKFQFRMLTWFSRRLQVQERKKRGIRLSMVR